MARTMLIDADLDKKFWEQAVATAVHIQNRSPKNGLTPYYELWNNEAPDLSHFRIFGSKALVHVKKNKRSKMDKVSVKAIFVGYTPDQKTYDFYIEEKNEIIFSRNVKNSLKK